MSNEEYIKEMQKYYESLRYFTISNNRLILKYDQKTTFMVPLFNVNLSNLNDILKNIFSLAPTPIFHIIYMFELLYKSSPLLPNEESFIEQYLNNYNKLNEDILNNNDDNNINLRDYLGIPIYKSYEINTPGSEKIHLFLNSYIENSQNGKGKARALVPKGGNNLYIVDEDSILDDISYSAKTGFATILLIAAAIILTCLYVAFFIFNR